MKKNSLLFMVPLLAFSSHAFAEDVCRIYYEAMPNPKSSSPILAMDNEGFTYWDDRRVTRKTSYLIPKILEASPKLGDSLKIVAQGYNQGGYMGNVSPAAWVEVAPAGDVSQFGDALEDFGAMISYVFYQESTLSECYGDLKFGNMGHNYKVTEANGEKLSEAFGVDFFDVLLDESDNDELGYSFDYNQWTSIDLNDEVDLEALLNSSITRYEADMNIDLELLKEDIYYMFIWQDWSEYNKGEAFVEIFGDVVTEEQLKPVRDALNKDIETYINKK